MLSREDVIETICLHTHTHTHNTSLKSFTISSEIKPHAFNKIFYTNKMFSEHTVLSIMCVCVCVWFSYVGQQCASVCVS